MIIPLVPVFSHGSLPSRYPPEATYVLTIVAVVHPASWFCILHRNFCLVHLVDQCYEVLLSASSLHGQLL
jgi:hypothetical protein